MGPESAPEASVEVVRKLANQRGKATLDELRRGISMVSDEIGSRVAVPSVGQDVQCNLRVIANLADRKRVYEARAVPPAKILGIKHRDVDQAVDLDSPVARRLVMGPDRVFR